jgi:hypothetical protein
MRAEKYNCNICKFEKRREFKTKINLAIRLSDACQIKKNFKEKNKKFRQNIFLTKNKKNLLI